MLDKKLGFVILNYNGDQVTINCVDSLIKYYPDSVICVIDNNSKIKTIDRIVDKYRQIENIKILKTDKNYGYAVGNNVGINYLRERGIEFIAVINNDTVFQNGDIYKNIVNIDEDTAILSLELDNIDGSKQIPYGLIKKAKTSFIKLGFLNFILLTRIYQGLRFFKRLIFRKKGNKQQNINYNQYDYVVSGAAFIITPNFFKFYSQLFNKTFLYCEEHILALYLQKARLKTKIIENSKIIHLESQTAQLSNMSTKKILKSFASWWKGLRVVFKSSKKIAKKYSDKNYKYEILK